MRQFKDPNFSLPKVGPIPVPSSDETIEELEDEDDLEGEDDEEE